MKINKRVVALILAGGLVLTGSPKNVKAEGLDKALSTDEIVQMCEASITKKLSYEEFCQLSYNAWMYLNDFGVVNVSLEDLYSIVYIINYANIQEEAKDKLINNGLVPSDVNVLFTELFNVAHIIATNNNNVYIEALENKTKVDREKLIYVSKFSIDERDKEIGYAYDNKLTDYIDSNKQDCNIYNELMNGYCHIPVGDLSTKYDLELASIGMEEVINLTSGFLFKGHIKDGHLSNESIHASKEEIEILEEHIGDISNLKNTLGGKCLTKTK